MIDYDCYHTITISYAWVCVECVFYEIFSCFRCAGSGERDKMMYSIYVCVRLDYSLEKEKIGRTQSFEAYLECRSIFLFFSCSSAEHSSLRERRYALTLRISPFRTIREPTATLTTTKTSQ